MQPRNRRGAATLLLWLLLSASCGTDVREGTATTEQPVAEDLSEPSPSARDGSAPVSTLPPDGATTSPPANPLQPGREEPAAGGTGLEVQVAPGVDAAAGDAAALLELAYGKAMHAALSSETEPFRFRRNFIVQITPTEFLIEGARSAGQEMPPIPIFNISTVGVVASDGSWMADIAESPSGIDSERTPLARVAQIGGLYAVCYYTDKRMAGDCSADTTMAEAEAKLFELTDEFYDSIEGLPLMVDVFPLALLSIAADPPPGGLIELLSAEPGRAWTFRVDTTWETPLLSALARAQDDAGDALGAFGLVDGPLQYEMVIGSDGQLMSVDLELSSMFEQLLDEWLPVGEDSAISAHDLFEIEQMAERMAWADHGDTGIAVDLSAPWMR